MTILDLTCRDCGCEYTVDNIGMSNIIHYNNKEIKSDKIKCPECGSILYSERCFDNPWED